MSLFQPAPPPKSVLGRYRPLAPTASVRVSPLCLGAMNFGESWKSFMGECNKETTFKILDFFYEQGGNFIDTANNYQNGESEIWIGEWMKERGVRDEIVLATKYTTDYRMGEKDKGIHANSTGNSFKSMRSSVDASLKKLGIEYIDLLYVHWWDFSTSVQEVMQGLNQLVKAGKVLYLGVSDTPAWVVSKANEYARQNGLAQFVVYQGRWNAAQRDFERDILPMVREEGMGLAPWSALGGGYFRSESKEGEKTEGRQAFRPIDDSFKKVSRALEALADRKGTAITSVALAYVMHKAPYVFPIVGGRKVEHLRGNIDALSLELSQEDIAEIEGATPFDIGFPMSFLVGAGPSSDPRQNFLLNGAAPFDYPSLSQPIPPPKKV